MIHVHEIQLAELSDDKALTRAVLQITQLLGLYQAELARVLGLQCGDIGDFAAARASLQAGTLAWAQARRFVALYECLFRYCAGDAVAMHHWLRARQANLPDTPLLMMVDAGRLDTVLAWFDSAAAGEAADVGKAKS